MLIDEKTNWGFIGHKDLLDKCIHLRETIICDMKQQEHNLNTTNKCLTEIYLRNSTNYCEKKLLKPNHDIWFEGIESNAWIFFTPSTIQLQIHKQGNESQMSLQGTGEIQLSSGMMIKTDHVEIRYKEAYTTSLKITVVEPTVDTITTIDNFWDIDKIPIIDEMHKILPITDHEAMKNLKTKLNHLNNDKITLMNVVSDPYNHPWSTVTIIIIVCLITIILKLSFKNICMFCPRKLYNHKKDYQVSKVDLELGSTPKHRHDSIDNKQALSDLINILINERASDISNMENECKNRNNVIIPKQPQQEKTEQSVKSNDKEIEQNKKANNKVKTKTIKKDEKPSEKIVSTNEDRMKGQGQGPSRMKQVLKEFE